MIKLIKALVAVYKIMQLFVNKKAVCPSIKYMKLNGTNNVSSFCVNFKVSNCSCAIYKNKVHINFHF